LDVTSEPSIRDAEPQVQRPAFRRRAPLARRFLRLSAPPDSAIIEAPHAVAAVRHRERLYRWSLVATDLAAVAGVILTAVIFGDAELRPLALLALPLVVFIAKAHALYDRDELLLNKTTIDEAPQIFQVSTLLALAFSLVDGHVLGTSFSPAGVLSLWFVLFAYMLLGRRFTRTVLKRAVAVERCVLVGDAVAFDRLEAKLQAVAKAELVGRMSPPPETHRDVDVHEQALRDLLDRAQAHRVIIDPQALPDREMLALVRTAKGLGARVSLLPSVHDVVGSEVVFDDLQGMTLLGVRRFGLSRSSRVLKRSFDLVGGLALTIVAAPLMIAIAIAIKLDSRGPVFFRQTRVGRGGRHFRIYKFRSMVANAEAMKDTLREYNEVADGLFKIADDPRITRVGRFLRRTSLDELAQLLNVLRGDMSLVGPRPLVLDEDRLISGADRSRLQLTPGMTGHWQIAGSSRIPMHEMVKIDYLYVASWSLWADIKILLRTVPYMLARRGQ
jgi:exopolysaccharide biosynthesis polyprenyl glycosylphosphotransferase